MGGSGLEIIDYRTDYRTDHVIFTVSDIMACSAIYFLDMKGKVLMNRNYRGDIENTVIDKFIGLFSSVMTFLMKLLYQQAL